jgi:hypothetical protein
MNLNDFFPYKVCINLDRRPDRWERVRARFARHDVQQVSRFPAFDWKVLTVPADWNDVPGAYACLLSHLEVVREARARREQSVLIFEDDVVFADDLNGKFSRVIEQVPSQWDMILFGGSHWSEPSRISDNVFRVHATAATHAYALNQTIFDAFIELNSGAQSVVDVNNTRLQRERECFCFMPHLAWQEPGYSDVGGREIDVWWMKDSLVLGSAEMHEVLKRTLVVLAHEGSTADAHALRRLDFILDHYLRLSPEIAVAVIEYGDRPGVDRQLLRRNCRYQFLRKASREDCYRTGFESFGDDRKYFIFAGSNVWISAGDIKANLLKCREHDVVSSFREIYDLSEADTARLIDGDEVTVAAHQHRKGPGRPSDSCFYTRHAVDTGVSLSIFESPNRAFRLYENERGSRL